MDWLPSIFKNFIGEINIRIQRLSIFSGNTKLVDKKKTYNTLNIENAIIVAEGGKLPNIVKEGQESFQKLTKTTAPLITGSSDIFYVSDEDKKNVNSRIDECVALMNLNRLDEARTSLLTILGEIKSNPQYSPEQVRVYNNLGVIYNRPKPEGDYDEAIKYFNEALSRDANFTKGKMNLASAYINKADIDSVNKGFDLISALWAVEKTPEILQVLLWGVYKKEDNPNKAIEFIEQENSVVEPLIKNKDSLLNLTAAFYLEAGKIEEAIAYNEQALTLAPEEPAFMTTKAKALMLRAQKNHIIPSEFDIIPKFTNYEDVKEALNLFGTAFSIAEKQRLDYLLSDIRYGISTCLLWLGKYDEAKHSLQKIKLQELPELLTHRVDILNFATHIHERNFETAYKTLVENENYSKLPYDEKFRVARVFLYNGAPEQAKSIYDSLSVEAEKYQDITFWLDISAVYVLLGKQQEAISAVAKVRDMAEQKDDNTKKVALSHYNAVMYHYSKRKDSHDSETGRLVEGMIDFQNKFPQEQIITEFNAIDEKGELTQEMKDMLTQMKDRYELIKNTFKKNPIPTYYLEKVFHRPYSDLIVNMSDSDFHIPFTDVSNQFVEELKNNFIQAKGFVFDYLILLDLAKMGYLGFLEKLEKPIYVHQLLFQKIQEELLQNEIEELRELWNYLRHSKVIKFIEGEIEANIKSEKLDDLFDKWLIESIKFAKANDLSIATNDLRLYLFLKSEQIKPINATILLSVWLSQKTIDQRMFSRAIGDLAERFYIFLSYRGEDLFEIVIEDAGKITPRSYHLVREVFLPGSILDTFTPVYVKFIDLLWRTGSLPQEKVNWIKFITSVITEIIDKDFEALKTADIKSQEEANYKVQQLGEKLKPAVNSLAFMWKSATASGNKDDLSELLKATDEVLNKPYLEQSINAIKQRIEERLKLM